MSLVSPESIDSSAARAHRPSTRPVRALTRGLETLALLHLCERATVAELAVRLRLPRTTTYRILETLCEAGFVRRSRHDDRYSATALARMLGERDDAQQALIHAAKAHVHRLCDELRWPVAVAMPAAGAMEVREAAPHAGGAGGPRYSTGFRVPMLSSACGRAWLAHCSAGELATLLELLSRSPRPEDRSAGDPALMRRLLVEVRDRGYATAERPHAVSDEIGLAVPVLLGDRAVGALTVRLSGSQVSLEQAVEELVPPLRRAASHIANAMSGTHAASSLQSETAAGALDG
jgi:IclR family mhp operon transcriptional activator